MLRRLFGHGHGHGEGGGRSLCLKFEPKSITSRSSRAPAPHLHPHPHPQPQHQPPHEPYKIWVTTAAVALVAFACYWPSLYNDLVFDDHPAIISNKDVRAHSVPFYRIFANDYWGHPIHKEESHKSWRPLTVLTFRLNYQLDGLRPFGYHLINNLLHSLVSALFFRFSLHYLHFWESLLSGCLFAIHPIHADAVASVVGRAELLAATFYVIVLLSYCRGRGRGGGGGGQQLSDGDDNANGGGAGEGAEERSGSAFLMVLLSLYGTLCKEQASTGLLVCFGHDLIFKYRLFHGKGRAERQRKCTRNEFGHNHKSCRNNGAANGYLKQNKGTLILILGFLFIAFFRLQIMRNTLPRFSRFDNPAQKQMSPFRQLTFAYLWAFNAWLLVFPFHLSCDWTSSSIEPISSLFDFRNLFTVAFFIIIITILRKADSITAMGLGMVVIPFLPASNLFFPMGTVVAERVLYTPSMGFSLVLARGVGSLCSSLSFSPTKRSWAKRLVMFAVVTLLASHSLQTLKRCKEWKNELALFASGLRVNPNNVKLLNNVGRIYQNRGNFTLAIEFYQKAIKIHPDDVRGYLNLGNAFAGMNRLKEAEDSYRGAIALLPKSKGATGGGQREAADEVGRVTGDAEGDEEGEGEEMESSSEKLLKSNYLNAGNNYSRKERMRRRSRRRENLLRDEVGSGAQGPGPGGGEEEEEGEGGRVGETAKVTPMHLDALLSLASLISADESRTEEADTIFSNVVHMRPDYKVTYSSWTQSMIHSNRSLEAELILSKAAQYHSDPDILHNLAVLVNNNGNPEDALAIFDRVLNLDPYHEKALVASARIMKEKMDRKAKEEGAEEGGGDGDLARLAYERLAFAASLGRADETVYFDLGMLAIRRGQREEAQRYLSKAIELKPDFAEALFNMALLLYKERRPFEALPFLEFLLKSDENHTKALILMIAIHSESDSDHGDDGAAQRFHRQLKQSQNYFLTSDNSAPSFVT